MTIENNDPAVIAQPAPTCAYEQMCRAQFAANYAAHPGLLSLMRPRCATLIKLTATQKEVCACQDLMGFAPCSP